MLHFVLVCLRAAHPCDRCHIAEVRDEEKKRIAQLDHHASATLTESDPFYLIHYPWLSKWRKFIAGSNEQPGPISNYEFFLPPPAQVIVAVCVFICLLMLKPR